MAVSILDIIAEEARQVRTGDSEYNKRGSWVFRIDSVPNKGPVGYDGFAIFPLPIPPTRFNYTLPFAAEVTPAQEGGVIPEEAGIVIGKIQISATTGWKLRPQKALTFGAEGGFFAGRSGDGGALTPDVSGQMSFWILASRCFEGYSLLKQDPETAHRTRMELHILKDQVYLEVIPKTFTLNRESGSQRVTYAYDIDLDVIGEAKPLDFDPRDEKSLLDEIRDTVSKVRQAVQALSAAVDDITAAISQLARLADSIVGIIDAIRGVIDSATGLIEGTKTIFDFPRSFMLALVSTVESAADLYDAADTLPADVGQALRSASDALDGMTVAARDQFAETWQTIATLYNGKIDPFWQTRADLGSALVLQTQQDEFAAEAASAQGTMSIDRAFSGTIKPGDAARRDKATVQQRLGTRDYTGFSERVVGQGDTLSSLAAKHLLDARKWVDLAVINKLNPPFITNGAQIPRTLRPGSKIVIPVSNPSVAAPVLTTGQEAVGEQSQAEVNLGTDFELVKLSNGQYGWAIDEAHGSVDGRLVTGLPNMGQGLESRLRTTRGESILFPSVGLPRLVGTSLLDDPTNEARLRVRQQLVADPRIDKVLGFNFSLEGDALSVTAKVLPIGFATARVISRTVR